MLHNLQTTIKAGETKSNKAPMTLDMIYMIFFALSQLVFYPMFKVKYLSEMSEIISVLKISMIFVKTNMKIIFLR